MKRPGFFRDDIAADDYSSVALKKRRRATTVVTNPGEKEPIATETAIRKAIRKTADNSRLVKRLFIIFGRENDAAIVTNDHFSREKFGAAVNTYR